MHHFPAFFFIFCVHYHNFIILCFFCDPSPLWPFPPPPRPPAVQLAAGGLGADGLPPRGVPLGPPPLGQCGWAQEGPSQLRAGLSRSGQLDTSKFSSYDPGRRTWSILVCHSFLPTVPDALSLPHASARQLVARQSRLSFRLSPSPQTLWSFKRCEPSVTFRPREYRTQPPGGSLRRRCDRRSGPTGSKLSRTQSVVRGGGRGAENPRPQPHPAVPHSQGPPRRGGGG